MRGNLPDDYGMHWRRCRKHNVRFHASDGACDLCLEESSIPYLRDGDAIDGCVCVTYIDGKAHISDTYRDGWMILGKGNTYGIHLFEGKLLAATHYESKEKAIENSEEIILVIP